jgi:hypothetical protein
VKPKLRIDEAEFDRKQTEFLKLLIETVKSSLSQHAVEGELYEELLETLTFNIASAIDGSLEMEDEAEPVIPVLAFALDDEGKEILLSDRGSWLHEYVFGSLHGGTSPGGPSEAENSVAESSSRTRVKLLQLPAGLSSEKASLEEARSSRACRYPGCRQYADEKIDFVLGPWSDRRSLPRLIDATALQGVFVAHNEWIEAICGEDWLPEDLFLFGRVFDQKKREVKTHKSVWMRFDAFWDGEKTVKDKARSFCAKCGDQFFLPESGCTQWLFFPQKPEKLPPVFSIAGLELGVTDDGWNRVRWVSMKGLKALDLVVIDPPTQEMERVDPDVAFKPKRPRLP